MNRTSFIKSLLFMAIVPTVIVEASEPKCMFNADIIKEKIRQLKEKYPPTGKSIECPPEWAKEYRVVRINGNIQRFS